MDLLELIVENYCFLSSASVRGFGSSSGLADRSTWMGLNDPHSAVSSFILQDMEKKKLAEGSEAGQLEANEK